MTESWPAALLGGLLLGGLLNLALQRLPRGRRLFAERPRCTRDGTPLTWPQLLPVFGWWLQRGRSAAGKPLSRLTAVLELSALILVLRVVAHSGLSAFSAYLITIGALLLLTAAIDWRHRLIYPLHMLAGALIGLAWGSRTLSDWSDILAGAAAGGLLFAALYGLGRLLFPTEEAPLGRGDIYLAGFIGAALGLRLLPAALLIGMSAAAVAALVLLELRRRGRTQATYLSYGSYLCFGALVVILSGPTPL